MTTTRSPLPAIVLAAGFSRRMGRCKLTLTLDGEPLVRRAVRAALDAGDLKAVRLIDLRHDYVLRQLERHDWQYVSRITGLEAAAMNVHFAAYLTEKKVSTR